MHVPEAPPFSCPNPGAHFTLYAFLAVNLVFGFFVVLCGSQAWLDRVMWYKRTGGLVSIPQVKLTRREYTALIVRRTLPYAAWCLVATLLELWLTPKLWPVQRRSLPLFVLILWTPLLLIAARRLSKDHWWRDRIRQDWGAASWAERVLRVAVGTWTIGFILAIVMGGQSLMRWGFVWWFPIPPVMLIGVVVQLVLFALVALLTRRR